MESQRAYSAVVVTGSLPNRTPHVILALVTCGVWAVVWIIAALVQQEHRWSITVDEWGTTFVTQQT